MLPSVAWCTTQINSESHCTWTGLTFETSQYYKPRNLSIMALNYHSSLISIFARCAFQLSNNWNASKQRSKSSPVGHLGRNQHPWHSTLLPLSLHPAVCRSGLFWLRQKQGICRREGVRRFGYRASMHDSLSNTGSSKTGQSTRCVEDPNRWMRTLVVESWR